MHNTFGVRVRQGLTDGRAMRFVMDTSLHRITDAHKQQYRDEGYFILERVIPDGHLALLRREYQALIDEIHKEMDKRGTDTIGVNQRNRQYLTVNCFKKRPALGGFLFSDAMAGICRATLGDDAYLMWDQFVVKGPGMPMPFEWHQDGGCIAHEHRPYVICWCALDDMDLENGTLHILPFSQAGVRERVPHRRDPNTQQPVGYFGPEPGIPVVAPAGSIAVYSSLSFHRSGPNISDRMRRSYLVQYSAEPMMNADGTGLFGNAEPFLKNGRKLAR